MRGRVHLDRLGGREVGLVVLDHEVHRLGGGPRAVDGTHRDRDLRRALLVETDGRGRAWPRVHGVAFAEVPDELDVGLNQTRKWAAVGLAAVGTKPFGSSSSGGTAPSSTSQSTRA